MAASFRAELVKVATTRGLLGLIAGAAFVASLGAFSTIASGEPESFAGPLREQQLFALASVNLALFALIAGIRLFTDEFRHGSIIPTLLVAPDRKKVLMAKVATAAGVGAALVIVALTVTLALALALLSLKGVQPGWIGQDVLAALGLVAAGSLWAVVGVGVGAAVRHQVAAIVGGLVWIVVVENIGAAFLGDAGRFLPGQAAHALASVSGLGEDLLTPLAGAALLAIYAVVFSLFGTAALVRRDISAA